MFFNNKSQSMTADCDLITSDDSFMTELQPTEFNQIFGGHYGGGRHKKYEKHHWEQKDDWKQDDWKQDDDKKDDWKKNHEKKDSYHSYPVVKCPPVYKHY
jgi:hypothetical protein